MRLTVQWQDRSREPHAGQFYMLRAWAADATPILSRPISVDDFDNQTGALTFLYQVKGEGTHKLAALKKGDTVELPENDIAVRAMVARRQIKEVAETTTEPAVGKKK